MNFSKLSLILLMPLALGACSIFSPYGTSNIPEPAPLPVYKAQMTPAEAWHKNVGTASGGDYLLLAPAVANNTIYTIDANGDFYATSVQGQSLWQKRFADGGKSGVASDGELIALVDARGTLQVFSTQKGKDLWHALVPSQALAAPTITDTQIFVKTIDGSVTAFDKATGQQQWQYQHMVQPLMLHAASSVLVSGNKAYVGFSDGKVVCLDVKTGDEIWMQRAAESNGISEIQRLIDIDSDLILQSGKLFVATYQGQVVALNPATGNIIWKQPNSIYANLAADDHNLYATQADGTMTAYDQAHGKAQWEQKAFAWRFLTGGTLYKQYLVVGDLQGFVHFVNAENGQPAGRIALARSSIINAPFACGANLCVIDTDGRLAALRG